MHACKSKQQIHENTSETVFFSNIEFFFSSTLLINSSLSYNIFLIVI